MELMAERGRQVFLMEAAGDRGLGLEEVEAVAETAYQMVAMVAQVQMAHA